MVVVRRSSSKFEAICSRDTLLEVTEATAADRTVVVLSAPSFNVNDDVDVVSFMMFLERPYRSRFVGLLFYDDDDSDCFVLSFAMIFCFDSKRSHCKAVGVK